MVQILRRIESCDWTNITVLEFHMPFIQLAQV